MRLRKHANMQTRKNIKKCHYYNKNKNKKCFFGQKCGYRLCPFKHNKVQMLVESECKSCNKCSFISKSNLDLNKHVRYCHEKASESHFEKEGIEEFEKDEMNFLSLKEKTGFDLTILVSVKSCNKCDFETHSEGRLRKHKQVMHQIKESNLNLIIGFKNDILSFVDTLKNMGIEMKEIRCQICDFKTHSYGELKMHEQAMH
jgi:hypothetical protein